MLRRLKHWLFGHEFRHAWRSQDTFQAVVAFVCPCGVSKRLTFPGQLVLNATKTGARATDAELEELKRMAGL